MKTATAPMKSVHFSQQADFFEVSQQAWTAQLGSEQKYRTPTERSLCVAPPSSLSRPNYEDILRRVSLVMHQHIIKCEQRLANAQPDDMETGLFHSSKMRAFDENSFLSPQFVYHFVRAPVARMGFLYGIKKHEVTFKVPTVTDIHTFLSELFNKAQLSAECTIVCLIYVERLMESAHVPLVATTWRPVLLCGLLLASKVWQDLSSWNSEFAQIYPEFSLEAINKLEVLFCREISWNLYISSSAYAKYYFALRSLTEKKDFRRNYNVMIGSVNAPGADMIETRSGEVKKTVFEAMTLSQSL